MILILGANGNVGTLLLERFVRSGVAAAGTLRRGRERPTIAGLTEWREVDLERPPTLAHALAGVDTVIWTPGVKLLPACIEVLEQADVAHVVVVSSASVHTRLESRGARAKRDAEARLRESRVRFTVIRPTMIYGNRRDRNLTRLLDWLERVPVFPMFGDGRALMQPVFIGDVVESLVRALDRTPRGRFYDLGGAEPVSYRQLLDTAGAALGVRPLLVPVPLGLSLAVVRGAGWLGLRALRDEQVLRLAEDKVVDNTPIRAELGIEPITFAEGIARQVAARRASGHGTASVELPGKVAS